MRVGHRIGRLLNRALDRLFTAVTPVVWIATVVLILIEAAVFVAPDLNPIVAWRPAPRSYAAFPTPVVSIHVEPTATSNLPPTWTPEPTLVPSTATLIPTATGTPTPTATQTAIPTATEPATATPSPTPTDGPTPTPCTGPRCPTATPTLAAMPFTLPPEAPVYTANKTNQNGCAWLGVVGRVLDQNGLGINGLFVLIEGNGIDLPVPTGPTTLGAGSYAITLADAPLDSSEHYILTLLDGSNQPLSASYYVPTFDDCKKNQLRIDFVQNH